MIAIVDLRRSSPSIEILEARIAPALAANILVGSLDGKTGFGAVGTTDFEVSGMAVSSAGDVNGDGFDDILVAGYGANGPTSAGVTYVIFGKANGFPKSLALADLDGTDGFKLNGGARFDKSGSSVSAAGDVNGDGFDDVIVGAPNKTANYPFANGAAYVVFGKSGGFPSSISLGALDGVNGFALIGAGQSGVPSDYAGYSVSGAGDINGDNFDDVIVGTAGSGAYVVFGKMNRFAATTSLPTMSAADGFKITPETSGTGFGTKVGRAGDVNHDGVSDVVIGANGVGSPGAAGAAYVVFGSSTTPFGTSLSASSLTGTNGFKIAGIAGDYAGQSVGAAGDVNGDGFDDVFIGAGGQYNLSGRHGSVYVIYGKTTAFSASIALSALNGTNGFRFDTVPGDAGHNDEFGRDTAGAGDVNGDGYDDLMIARASAGQMFVVYGRADFPASQIISATMLNGANGFTVNTTSSNAALGAALSSAGDVNNDGFADLLVGAPGTPNISRGTSYVIFGAPQVAISMDGKTATMFESDGDLVTVKTTKGSFHRSDFTLESGSLQAIDLTRDLAGFSGASITVSATTPSGGTGDGEVHLGALKATGIDLAAVTIDGDLGQLDAGDGTLTTPGAGVVSVYSLGRYGLDTQAAGGSLQSDIGGGFSALKVLTGIYGASVNATGGPIGAITVGDSVSGAKIGAGTTLGAITIGGDLLDSTISALGKAAPATTAAALAIKSFTVGGNVENSLVLAGYNFAGEAKNPDVQIGAVKVDGVWSASTIAAGATSGTDLLFGTTDDGLITPGAPFTDQPAITARITSITIAAGVLGTSDPTTDHFGFVAQEVGSFKIGVTAFPLTTGLDDLAVGATGDVNIFEIGASAPATPPTTPGLNVAATGKSATFTDVDGDLVTVKSSKGGLTAGMFHLAASGSVGGEQLQTLDLTTLGLFGGTDITISAKRSNAGGDGFVNVGFISASGVDLGKVTLAGDLGRIEAGDGDAAKPAVKALSVFSIGRFATDTQAAPGSLLSDFSGALGALNVRSDIIGATLIATGGAIGAVKINGNVSNGRLATDSTLGAVTIGGDLVDFRISALGTLAPANAAKAVAIKSLKVGGRVEGSEILAGYDLAGAAQNGDANIGAVTITGDWLASNLVAGVKDDTTDGFGRNDVLIANATPKILAKIASVIIGGNAFGSTNATEFFGITAEQIGKLSVSGVKRIVTKTANDFLLDPANGNFHAIDFV